MLLSSNVSDSITLHSNISGGDTACTVPLHWVRRWQVAFSNCHAISQSAEQNIDLTLTLTVSRSPMRREGGTTLTSLTKASAMALRRFSLLLPFGYACRPNETHWNPLRHDWFFQLLLWVFVCFCLFYLTRVKVGARQQILQVGVSVWLGLLQHNHRVGLSEERTSGSRLPHFYQLHHDLLSRSEMLMVRSTWGDAPADQTEAHLLVEVNESVVRQLEGLDGHQNWVPVASVYVFYEAFDALHRVEGDGGFLL